MVAALTVAGCGSQESATTTGPAVTTSSTTVAASTTTVASTTTTTLSTTTTPVPEPALVLRNDGLGMISFGDHTDAVVEAITSAYGPVLDQGSIACDSGSDQYVTFAGLTTIHDAGRWAGWAYGTGVVSPAETLTTEEGIGLGSTLGALQAVYGADLDVFEATLGPEFFVGTDYPGLGGFLTGTGNNDTVTVLYAGDLCAFR